MPEYSPDFPPPVTAQPPPFDNSPVHQTQQSADRSPTTGVNPPAADTAPADSDAVIVGNLDDEPFISGVTITQTVEASATTIINTLAVAVVSTQIYVVEFYSPFVQQTALVNANDRLRLTVWRDSTDLGRAAVLEGGSGVPVFFRYYDFNPAAGNVTYYVKGSVANSGESWTVSAQGGGAGNQTRGYIRVDQTL